VSFYQMIRQPTKSVQADFRCDFIISDLYVYVRCDFIISDLYVYVRCDFIISDLYVYVYVRHVAIY